MRSRTAKLITLLLMAAALQLSGCVSTQNQGWLDRMFPADPDDSFLGDEAREIDKRLSNKAPQVNF